MRRVVVGGYFMNHSIGWITKLPTEWGLYFSYLLELGVNCR